MTSKFDSSTRTTEKFEIESKTDGIVSIFATSGRPSRSLTPGVESPKRYLLQNMANDGLHSDHRYSERVGSVAIFTLAWKFLTNIEQ